MQEWWDAGWVEPFPEGEKNIYNSAWLAVEKKSGGKVTVGDARVCIDFRPGNKRSKDPVYFVPRVKDLLTKKWGKKVFTELDLANAYHQIKLSEESKKYAEFYFPGKGQFVWNVLFFGVKGAVTHFQRVMEQALSGLPDHIVVVIYVDNILVVSDDVESHVKHVEAVVKKLNDANLRLRPEKCKVLYKSIQFMGMIVDGERRGVDPFKAKVFQEMEAPKTGKGVQAILGFINFLRDYIPLYASLAAPLESLRNTKVITEKLWEESGVREAFERLKEVLSNAPVLHTPDFDLPFIMESDASQYGVGVVLLQEVGPKKERRYVDFAAKALSKSQESYPGAKRELLGGLFGMKRWRSWLLFNKFTWGMDSKAMTYINSSTHQMVLNWIYLFAEFDFETSFKKGILNVLPDSLSRLYDCLELDFGRGEGRGGEEEKEQGEEKVKSGVVMLAGMGRKYKVSKERFLWECENKTQLEGEEEKKKEMLKKLHKENHAGVAILFKTVWEEGYWWPTLWDDCEKEIAKCKECKLFNVERGGFHLMKTILANKPMDHVMMDLAGPFKTSEGGYCFVLIIVDVLTHFCWLHPLMRKTAEDVVWVLSEVFANFGVPKIVQSDNDPSFCNQVVEEFQGLAGFKHRRIMAYFPRTNGPVESWVRQTKDLLKKWMVGDDVEWPKYIPAIQMSLNDKICSRHGSRPFDVMFGEWF